VEIEDIKAITFSENNILKKDLRPKQQTEKKSETQKPEPVVNISNSNNSSNNHNNHNPVVTKTHMFSPSNKNDIEVDVEGDSTWDMYFNTISFIDQNIDSVCYFFPSPQIS
jgi:hypothetical protein